MWAAQRERNRLYNGENGQLDNMKQETDFGPTELQVVKKVPSSNVFIN